jgi:hypothetical protein
VRTLVQVLLGGYKAIISRLKRRDLEVRTYFAARDALVAVVLVLNTRSRCLLATNALCANANLAPKDAVYTSLRVNTLALDAVCSISGALKDIKLASGRRGNFLKLLS